MTSFRGIATLRHLVVGLALVTCAALPPAGAPTTPTVTPTAVPSATGSPSPTSTGATATPSPRPALPTNAAANAAAALLPIVDAHLHYSREAWNVYPPGRVAALMDQMGVRRAFVSSAPDEGTFRLRPALGDRVVAMLGPYRGPQDVFNWTRDATILPYLESSFRAGVHRGFGEFHLNPGQVGLPIVQQTIEFARARGLFLQPHADARALAELLDVVGPDQVVLWAHAGVTATPDEIDALLARWPKLWVELSLRDDVSRGGVLQARWHQLFVKYPDRFMVGIDTWTVGGGATGNERWDRYPTIIHEIRLWLFQLPLELARNVAHANAERFIAALR